MAWIRTSLALLAAGIAVRQIGPGDLQGGRTTLAMVAISVAAATALLAYRRWSSVQEAMRHHRPLPSVPAIKLLTATLVVLAVVTAYYIIK